MKFVVKEVDIVCDFVLFLLVFIEEDSSRIINDRNKLFRLRFLRRRFYDVNIFAISFNDEYKGIIENK